MEIENMYENIFKYKAIWMDGYGLWMKSNKKIKYRMDNAQTEKNSQRKNILSWKGGNVMKFSIDKLKRLSLNPKRISLIQVLANNSIETKIGSALVN